MNSKTSKSNSNRSNRNCSNNDNDHDSNANSTSSRNSTKSNTSKKRMKVVIVVLAALILVVLRTTILCSGKLNIHTNHNTSNGCSSTTTIATINTNIRNYGSSNGYNNNRINTQTHISKMLATVEITA